MKFALFYEIPVAKPVDTGQGAPGLQGHPRAGRSSATRWASTRSGPWSTTSSRSTRTAPTPRCSTARSPRAPRTSASGTACACCRSRTTTRSAPPSRSRCSTSSPTGASTSAPAARRRAPSSKGFDVDPDETRAMWREALGHIVGAWTEDEYQAARRVLADGRAAPGAPEAAPAAAPADLRRHQQPARPRGDGPARHRPVLVHRRPPARAARREHRDVPQGPRRVHAAGGQVRQRHRGHVHDGALRAHQRGGHRGRRASRSSGTRSTAAASSRRSPSGRRSAASPATRSTPTSTPATR